MKTFLERFFDNVEPEPNSGCWLWIGGMYRNGYGSMSNGAERPRLLAHRFSYEIVHGPIPPEMQIDHRCRLKSCVNPNHLEVVTCRENLLRGHHPRMIASKTNTCKRGHALPPTPPPGRSCKTCEQIRRRERYLKSNKEENHQRNRAWYWRNIEKSRADQRKIYWDKKALVALSGKK